MSPTLCLMSRGHRTNHELADGMLTRRARDSALMWRLGDTVMIFCQWHLVGAVEELSWRAPAR